MELEFNFTVNKMDTDRNLIEKTCKINKSKGKNSFRKTYGRRDSTDINLQNAKMPIF